MIHKTYSPVSGFVQVTFELPACIWASHIVLVIGMNSQEYTQIPFRQNENGAWEVVVDLPVGREVRFRYLINGEPRTDGNADGFSSCTGSLDYSVVKTTL